VAALAGLDVALHLGRHDQADFTDADLLVTNPAVPKDHPLLIESRRRGVARTTEINLFLERCPARMVGVTGSVGKSTTTAMLGAVLATKLTTHVGGNIGGSLLESLPMIRPEHVVVLELSSFQLEDLPLVGVSPQVAVVTNLQPNHLDRHGTMEAYGDAKRNIFRFQGPSDVLVLNADCPVSSAWSKEARGRVVFFRAADEPFELAVPGEHNQANAQAAWTAARELGVPRDAAASALKGFRGLPHRLQFVADRGGVRYFNDSKCTTPEGAAVAIRSFEPGRVVIIVGGYDKHVSFDRMGAELAGRAKAVVALGATSEQILQAVAKALPQASRASANQGTASDAGRAGPAAQPSVARPLTPALLQAQGLAEAVAMARSQAAVGDVVLLSPACASYDMFVNYEDRGRQFVELVNAVK
jgi:UDP-N-acetylmuramoylalanine--D-glutamate ligase